MAVLETDTGPRPKGTNINLSFGYHPGYPGNPENVHYGTDLRAADGDPDTYPENLGPGLVIIAGSFGGYGTAMVIRWIDDEGTRWYLLYGHMLRLFYAAGQVVQAGAVIGESDHSGFVVPKGPGGAHLHFAIGREGYYGGAWVDPIPWLAKYTAPREPTEQEQLEMAFTPEQLANLKVTADAGITMEEYTSLKSLHRRVSDLMNFIDDDYEWITQIADEDTVKWILAFKGYLSPVGYAARDALFDSAHDPGTPNNHVAIGIRRLNEFFQALQLTIDQVKALPSPKYDTLKAFIIDLQEQAQEQPAGPPTAGGTTPPVVTPHP